MRAVVQRVTEASVSVGDRTTGAIEGGLMVLVGVDTADTEADATYLAEKIAGLRIFSNSESKFNLSLEDVGGAVLLVSQFTLHGDCRKGRRPSFTQAARPDQAIPLYERVAELLRARGIRVETGEFGAHMQVHLVNDGPVTLLLDSRKAF
ncbi:MAG: D-tyrosyl-tRNA(Tyr) deacylase [Candidatus Hydrogenedentes bacterium]|nr:D-tyrosyl-tRNA(Tyr) deacylase [Candidatus Hydrogenedentota bacterium]